jgi:hypothetical protein
VTTHFPLKRRLPVVRKMRFMRYAASKDLPPARKVEFNRCRHGELIGVHVRWDMRCYSWLWRLCK